MNKFKKVMLGALSVLTLGLFVVVGTKVTAASTQPYVNASFISLSGNDNEGTAWSTSTKNARSLTVNGFTFNITASDTKSLNSNANGIRLKGSDNEMNFTTLDTAKVTITLFNNSASRNMTVTNNQNLSVTNIAGNGTATTVSNQVISGNYKYSLSNSGTLQIITVDYCPAATFHISNSTSGGGDVYVQSVKIQPYATVTYHTNGGDAIVSTTTLYGETFAPATPTYDGYAFMGWYTDESLETAYNTSAIVSDNIDLYADWVSESSVNKYTVSFYKAAEATTDNLIESVEEVVEGTTVNVSLIDAPTPAFGKQFTEWRLISDDSVFDSTTVVNSDLAVYAVYSNISTSDANSLSPDLITYTYNYGYTSSNKVSKTTALTPSNYSALNGTYIDSKTAYANINGKKPSLCFHTGGTYSSDNGGVNGLEVTFSQDVMLKIYCASTDSKNPADFIMYDVNASSNYLNLEDGIAKSGSQTELKVYVPAGTYQIGSDRAIRIWAIEKVDMNANTEASFDAQYNEELAADSTKLRFIGTISGVAYANYASITKMEFTFTFNGSNRTCEVSKLYKSITSNNTTVKSVADNTMYVVYELRNINKKDYQEKSLTNCKFVITFADGTSTSITHADITLPTTFTTVVA